MDAKLLIGNITPTEPTDVELRRNLGTGQFVEKIQKDAAGNESTVREMVGVAYNSKDNAEFAVRNSERLMEKVQVDHLNIVHVREQLSIEEMFSVISKKRKSGENYNMDAYFKDFGYVHNDGSQYTMDSFLHRLGFDKKRHTLQFFVDTSIGYGKHYLIPEVIREIVFRAMIQEPRFNLLTGGRNIGISLPEAKLPEVVYGGDDLLMEDIGEAENLPEVSISFTDRTVRVYRRGIRVPINGDVVRYVSYPVLAQTLTQIGWRLANQLSDLAISTLLNGDLPNYGYPAGVLGVDNTTNKFAYIDAVRITTRYQQTQYRPNVALANETEVNRIKNSSDFKPSGNNAPPLFLFQDINGKQEGVILVPNDQIADHKQLWVDTRYAMSQLTLEALSVENERHAQTDQWEYYLRLATGFQNEDQQAKLLVDGTQAFSSTGFPSYLTLVK